MGKKYDAILCDLGNVLINFDHRIAVRKILRYTPKNEEEIYSLFFDSSFTELYEEGKIDPAEFFRRVKKTIKLDLDYDEFFLIWNDIFFETPLNKKMQDFLKKVTSVYKLVMISNLNVTHFGFLKKQMDIFKEFDSLILSYETGCRKPAPEIYRAALASVRASSDKAFYIDDRQDLIEAASGLGIKGIVFDNENAFEKIERVLGNDFS
ncbi:MAG: HAD-IA family hydrolase [Candidatus Omnitrophica bacterium]|nr:HAD-IA family hydrolase [Candidatus Omnitrophota bacterium]